MNFILILYTGKVVLQINSRILTENRYKQTSQQTREDWKQENDAQRNIFFLSVGIVVVTDGVVGIPEANLLELLLTQLRNSTISCSFLKVGSARNIQRQLGHVPNYELMQFIATATFGGYFMSCPDVVSRASLPS